MRCEIREQLRVIGAVIAIAAVVSGCRAADFLYVQPERKSQLQGFDHKLKELTGNDKLDLLWVIDNSGSMGDHQLNVIRNTERFMKLFIQNKDIKWKMGLISTDEGDRPYVGFTPTLNLDYKTSNPVQVFQDAVDRLGTDGDSREKTFIPLIDNLTIFPDFLRPGSVLNIVVITDAPEQSGIGAESFLKLLSKSTPTQERIAIYGILAATDFTCEATDTPWDYEGSPYQAIIETTLGKVFSLCDTNFSRHLLEIGEDMIKRHTFGTLPLPLDARPDPASIRVLLHGREIPGGPRSRGGYWNYNHRWNAIQFNSFEFATGDNESVRVEYLPADGF